MKQIGLGIFLNIICLMGFAEPVLIDVRTPMEFEQEHADGAINLPLNNIEERIEIDKDADIYLYCHSGRRAGLAKDILIEMGYTHVTNLKTLSDAKSFVEQVKEEGAEKQE